MILHRFLKEERNIETEVVVGYVNDGTDDIFISHAWIEHFGAKTDLTLHLTEQAHSSGALLVNDEVLRQGREDYTYHRQRTQAGLLQSMTMMRDPDLGPLTVHKEQEHQIMLARANNSVLMKAYIDAAPSGQGYEAMTSVLR